MTLAKALAFSIGNKARTFNDQGGSIVVQERYSSITEQWLHVWHIREAGVYEVDMPISRIEALKTVYGVDPDADYWIVV